MSVSTLPKRKSSPGRATGDTRPARSASADKASYKSKHQRLHTMIQELRHDSDKLLQNANKLLARLT